MNVPEILKNIRQQPGDKAKTLVLEQNKNSELLKRVFALAYDSNRYQFGVSYSTFKRLLKSVDPVQGTTSTLLDVVKFLENSMSTPDAKIKLAQMTKTLPEDEQELIKDIINRNLKVDIAAKTSAEIFGNIQQMPYMRCGIFDEKTVKNISFPAFLQLKMDGTYRQIDVFDDVTIRTRQGKVDYNLELRSIFLHAPKGTYIGELTIPGMPRVQSNGLINSNDPPVEKIVFTAWDYLQPGQDLPYSERFKQLQEYLPKSNNTKIVLTKIVNNIPEVKEIVSGWMQEGLEGGVLKDFSNKYKSGTSKTQLKVKKIVDADVRIVGFKEGALRSAREGKVGALKYETDDKLVSGYVSGFNASFLDAFSQAPSKFIGKIMTVRFNDIHKNKDSWSLQLPRFIELRDDKSTTDTLDRIQEMLGMKQVL